MTWFLKHHTTNVLHHQIILSLKHCTTRASRNFKEYKEFNVVNVVKVLKVVANVTPKYLDTKNYI